MYGSLEGVLAIAPAVGEIDENSTPTSAQVDEWLNEGSALIDAALSGAGYVVPVSRTAAIYPAFRSLENLYATAYTLRARGLDMVQGQQESRSETYLKDFWSTLAGLVKMDLTSQGVPVRTSPSATRRGVRSMQLRRVDGYSKDTLGVTE
jgi:hypothetical protein